MSEGRMARNSQQSLNAGGNSGANARNTSGKNAWSSQRRANIVVGIGVASALLLVSLFAFYAFEQFLIGDGRFAIANDDGGENPSVHVQGVTYASQRSIENVFSEDTGHSAYLLPLGTRRDTLRAIDWVKDATVARVWPNRVFVRVQERRPVAFVALTSSRFGLIDEDGVILRPVTARFHLPVLKGIRTLDTLQVRREKVRRMQHLLAELGDAAGKISEVDTGERDNAKVTQPWDGRMMTLELGDTNFANRYQNFAKHFAEIKTSSPHGTQVDLRIDGKITVLDP